MKEYKMNSKMFKNGGSYVVTVPFWIIEKIGKKERIDVMFGVDE